ncbi:22857_t:CDS:2 [Gigaspora margarita]|uniref:22857_t:CDS:1 n=1 Tax=Gigaspora margarita TaxID=4874 RepID=A0ABN7V9B1_GIGMA|nr:22857_t:CDS:2 [Gigaspora margarita]
MQAATSQTKVKKSSENINMSSRSQTKTKLPDNIELEEYSITTNKSKQCKAEIILKVFSKKEKQLLKESWGLSFICNNIVRITFNKETNKELKRR